MRQKLRFALRQVVILLTFPLSAQPSICGETPLGSPILPAKIHGRSNALAVAAEQRTEWERMSRGRVRAEWTELRNDNYQRVPFCFREQTA
jgi:hypothetical protein